MHALNGFLFLVSPCLDVDFAHVEDVAEHRAELTLAALESFLAQFTPHLPHRVDAFRHLLKGFSDERRVVIGHQDGFVRAVVLPVVALRWFGNPSAFSFGPPHPALRVQGAAFVLDLWSGQVKGQHQLVFWNGRIDGLLYRLRLDAEIHQLADHPVRGLGVAGEPIPLDEEHQVHFVAMPGDVFDQFVKGGAVERFGRCIILKVSCNVDAFERAVLPKPLLLPSQAVPGPRLLVR